MQEKEKYRKSRKSKRRPIKDGAKCNRPKCQVCHYAKVHKIKSHKEMIMETEDLNYDEWLDEEELTEEQIILRDWMIEMNKKDECPCGTGCDGIGGMWYEAAYHPELLSDNDWDEVKEAYERYVNT